MQFTFDKLKCFALSAAMVAMTIPALGQAPDKQMPPDPQQQPQTQSPSPDSSTTTPTSSSSQSEQSFMGTIGQSESGYVLKDSTGVTYQLDDQKKAKDFSGQNVKVTGTLDSSTNMIRVASISPAS